VTSRAAFGALAAAAATMLAGCATAPPRPTAAAGSPPGLAGWDALVAGHRADAERLFAAHGDDLVAAFGAATVAYERGDSRRAADGYAALLAMLAAHGSQNDGHAPGMAVVAAGRASALYDELTPVDGAAFVARLRPAALSRAPALPWLARLELVRLAEHDARRRGDADAVARAAADDGCATLMFEGETLGRLPNLDLDAAAQPSAPASWRPLTTSGCQLTLVAGRDGQGSARVLRAAVEVGAPGTYTLVLDYAAEARLAVDGSERVAHGAPDRYGPRISAFSVALGAGRHDIELRLATGGGRAGFTLMLLPDGAEDAAAAARFVDLRVAGAAAAQTRPAVVLSPSPAPGLASGDALAAYCAAFGAAEREAVDEAGRAVDQLRALPRFALGLSLAGVTARDDPSRPASFARDAARRALRGAVAIDPGLARAWQALATVELDDDRARDAIEAARGAERAAPEWWAPDLVLERALAVRGLDFDADRALDQAARKSAGTEERAACPVLQALHRRAGERRQLERAARLESALAACGGNVEARVDRLRARGEGAAAIALLRGALRLDPERDDLAVDLALSLAAGGRQMDAVAELGALVAREPNDPAFRVRLADAQAAAGQLTAARETIAAAVLANPEVPEVRHAARALGVALPLDGFRVDGRAAIRAFEASSRSYTSPAVMVLDRSVMRVFASGAVMTLTHEIVRVDSKDAIDRWGEIAVPAGAEILTLRTYKPDGTTREPEEIAGKETISAPDLAIGDYVEWELLEAHGPSAAFAPGFLTDRFFFQSFDAPLARTELLLVAPATMELGFDRRAGAPREEVRTAADGTRVVSFAASDVPQLFAERAAVPAIEYVPSVRASSGVDWGRWARYLAEELHDAVRASGDVRVQAEALRRQVKESGTPDPRRLAEALVGWVTDNIEATDDLTEPATFTLARGRGSRIALTLAMARELGIPARAVLARSRLTADAGAPAPAQELDDFADALIELDLGVPGQPRPKYVDLRLRHAALGYLPPALDGARTLALPDGGFGVARNGGGEDQRTIDMTIRLDEQGSGVAVATEDLAGWPALEWAELVDRFGADRVRLRQDFEQRWLGVQFPGAHLRDLEVDLPRPGSGRAGTARVRYSFVSAHLAVPIDRNAAGGGAVEMRLLPTFFRSQPGRRFAAEPQRATALVLGFDVPVRLTATVELPGAAGVEPGGAAKDLVVARAGGYRFVEERAVRPGPAGRSSVLVLHRESALPIMRVSPGEYPSVAADLRRVDGAEQEEIRIRLPGRGAPR
jgi:hypothetical protein